jgi:septal ring factor EnvC (AmiA/AmiB activator)
MSPHRDAERHTITAAMQRLFDGRPERSTGALTVLQLAAEAGVKRWVLTHKHPDPKTEFERQRAAVNGVPAAYQGLAAQISDLTATNERLRIQNSELQQRVDAYAQAIYRLSAEVQQLRAEQPGNVHPLRPRSRPT